MNHEQIAGNWKQMAGLLTKKWGKLTGDDFAIAKGNRQIIAGRLEEYYGIAKADAEEQLDDYLAEFDREHVHEVAKEGSPLDMKTLKIGM